MVIGKSKLKHGDISLYTRKLNPCRCIECKNSFRIYCNNLRKIKKDLKEMRENRKIKLIRVGLWTL